MSEISAILGTKKTRVFVVEDNAFVREGLKRLLECRSYFSVCGEADTAKTAVELISSLEPDIAVIDLSLHGENMEGIELIRILRARAIRTRILVLSAHEELIYARKILSAGAQGYLMKQNARKHLAHAIRQVLSGKTYLSDGVNVRSAVDSEGKEVADAAENSRS